MTVILQLTIIFTGFLQLWAASWPSTGTAFTCAVDHSRTKPTSVHNLRPSDIDVVAAIGDSLTAGMGIYSTSLLTIFTQYRGHSFTMGGEVSLEDHVSLPNILKKFNPRLTGFSTGVGGPDGKNAHFNVAVVGERAEGMPGQAQKVVQRMRETLGPMFETDWKLINLFIGGNDICDYCKFPDRFSPQKYISNVRRALDYFHQNVPRALVNLILTVDASPVADIQELSLTCKLLFQSFWCRCAATRPRNEVVNYVRQLQNLTLDLYAEGRYDDRDDFTVVLQPFFRHTYPPLKPNGEVDLTYLAPDCFHFGPKANAIAALSLWRNMMEPVGQKTEKVVWTEPLNLVCPTQDRPYISTKKNS